MYRIGETYGGAIVVEMTRDEYFSFLGQSLIGIDEDTYFDADAAVRLVCAIFGERRTAYKHDIPDEGVLRSFVVAVQNVLSQLTKKEQKALDLKFGLSGGKGLTDEQVSKELGNTEYHARELIAKGLRKLRHPLRTRHIRDFLAPLGLITNESPEDSDLAEWCKNYLLLELVGVVSDKGRKANGIAKWCKDYLQRLDRDQRYYSSH